MYFKRARCNLGVVYENCKLDRELTGIGISASFQRSRVYVLWFLLA